jgi:hypothetical protein
VTAYVTDDAGVRRQAAAADGAWAVVLDQPCEGAISPVCFRDASGRLVAPVLPADWVRTPVVDADEACPACGEQQGWDEARADDASRGTRGPGMQPTPFVVCRACGYEHSVGAFLTAAWEEEPAPEELDRLTRAAEAELHRRGQDALRGVRFSVYAARGWAGRIAGWGSSGGTMTSVAVEHGAPAGAPGPALWVQTEQEPDRHESERARARSTLAGALSEDVTAWPERSQAGLAILLHVRERERLRRAARAIAADRTLLVDGEPTSFATVAAGDRWVAVARRGALVISVSARDVDPGAVELATLADPLRELG